MQQQTAVEWLMEKYYSRQVYEENIWDEEVDQAKKMEANQSDRDYQQGFSDGYGEGYDKGMSDYNRF